jgi:hypothetical protein
MLYLARMCTCCLPAWTTLLSVWLWSRVAAVDVLCMCAYCTWSMHEWSNVFGKFSAEQNCEVVVSLSLFVSCANLGSEFSTALGTSKVQPDGASVAP